MTFSLKTKDRAQAERKARKVSVRLDDEWLRLRETIKKAAPKEHPSGQGIAEVGGKLVPASPPPGGWPKPERITGSVEEFERAEHDYQVDAEAFERAEEVAEEDAARMVDALRRTGLTLYAAQAPAAPAPVQTKGATLDELVGHWERERRPNSKTAAKMKLAALEFNLLHKDPSVQAVTRPMVIAYRSHLLSQKKGDGTQKYAKGTIDDRLSNIGTLLALAFDHGIVPANVAAKAALPPDKMATKARIGYTHEQAEKVMAGTEQYRETEPARYWIPRLARWTGARLNELHQLRRQDLTERDGIRGISIIDEGEHAEGIPMRMKNAASRRWVPLHEEVADFWTWAQSQPAGPLFPAKPDKHGIVSTELSKWMGRQLRTAWGITDRRVVAAHGFRHAFADACRASGVQDSVRLALMGHAEGGAAGGYGSGELPPKVLADAMKKLARKL